MTDAADKAHDIKTRETADGERLVEHSTFTPGDRDLRELMDGAETERVNAYREAGYVAGPNTGDYHAVRRNAKLAGPLLASVGGHEDGDPSAMAVEVVRENVGEDLKRAGAARKAARAEGTPRGRRSRSDAMTGGNTGGQQSGGAEGVGKSASSTGTDTTDRTADASVGSAPANPQNDGIENTPQDRPKASDATTKSGTKSGTGTGSSTGTGKARS